ncbi:MAG TPA: RidA family protein [Steroidobacteraceae bacterium]|nr:RidA family protein [Steroidobacteraceae bacterium]
MTTDDRLKQLGMELPAAIKPIAAFVMAARTGDLLFVSGHIARKDGRPWTGQLGRNMTTADGKTAAHAVALDLLATLQDSLGSLDKVKRIVKALCLVNSTGDFTEQHLVANGCSELLVSVFGERGAHARSAFGVAQLPMGACVEVELVVEV